jgi:CBS domain-containing protein
MLVRQLLSRTELQLVTCRPDHSIREAASLLSSALIGALPVMEGGRLVGILSERDVCHGLARHGGAAADLPVRELMTQDVATCAAEDPVHDARATMAHRHIRHLPVVEGGDLIGMISLRDVLRATVDEVKLEADVLRDIARVKASTPGA